MPYKALLTATIAATLSLSSLAAFAQHYDKRGKVIIIQQQPDRDHRSERWDDRKDMRDDGRRNDRRVYIGSDRRDDHRRSDRYDNRHDRRDDRYDNRYYYGARGPGFVRGHRLPNELRVSQYVVTDYQRHRLPRPAQGQHWVQVGGDYVLAAVATGIITSIILNH